MSSATLGVQDCTVYTFFYSPTLEIIQGPRNTTVLLGERAVFTCEVTGDASDWIVNGTLLNDLPRGIQSDVTTVATNTAERTTVMVLTIPARAEYNGTGVQCLTVTFGVGLTGSETATLNIRGMLAFLRVDVCAR